MTDATRPDSDAPRAGWVVAERYQLGKLIGEGRTGKVYRAHDLRSPDRVAVKLLHKPLCSVPDSVRRFAREFEATSTIDHPNVVRSLAFGQQPDGPLNGTHYLVMELVDGKRLGDVLKGDRALDTPRAVRITLDVARALAAAHAHGVVHRDIEPNNVILQRSKGREVAKVLDFGLARLATNTDDALTDFGVRLGTAEYMSPEYIESGEIEPRSDVYGLGILLYALLTGAPPFGGRMLTVMQEHVSGVPAAPSTRVPGIAGWLEALVMEMLAKAPEQRPAADEVVERLEEHLPALDAEAGSERRAHAAFEPIAITVAAVAAVAHHSESEQPVYPDPKPIPRLPLLLTVGLIGFALFGMVSITAILGLLLVSVI